MGSEVMRRFGSTEMLKGSQMVDEYIWGRLVPRPRHLSGPLLASFLQAYRCRPDSDAPCLNMELLHITCAECDTGPRLLLGCGTRHADGWIGIDCQSDGCDLLWDLQFPLPWPLNSVNEIVAQDILEHLKGWHEILLGWLECLRVGGKISIRVPDMTAGNALRDPGHVNLYSASSLDWLFDDEIYRAKEMRRGLVVECVSRRPVVKGEQTWNLVKMEPTIR